MISTCHCLHLSRSVQTQSEDRCGPSGTESGTLLSSVCPHPGRGSPLRYTFTFPLLSISLQFTVDRSKAQRSETTLLRSHSEFRGRRENENPGLCSPAFLSWAPKDNIPRMTGGMQGARFAQVNQQPRPCGIRFQLGMQAERRD